MAKSTVLIVDDEPDLVELVGLTLARMNLQTASAANLAQAKEKLAAQRFDLCLTDMRLPDGDGLDLVAWIQERLPAAAGGGHHGARQRGVGRPGAEARGLRFCLQAARSRVLRKLVAAAIRLAEPAPIRPKRRRVDRSCSATRWRCRTCAN
jgi:two-component system, NtrC family, response regulator PilR